MTPKRRQWLLAVFAPAVLFIVVEIIRTLLFPSAVSDTVVLFVILGLALLGIMIFAVIMLRDLEATQRQVVQQNRQLAALDEASIVIASELELKRVLQRITDIARELSGARYAALGVLGSDGYLTDLITAGLSGEDRDAIGPLPKSHGILGKMLREGHAVRIADMDHAPDRTGFPQSHPHMRKLMGVPILSGRTIIGNLYLSDKMDGGQFSDDDERLIVLLAAHASVAIQNARLHEQVQRLVVLEERERIGRELHDGTIQSIYATSLVMEDAQELIDEEPEAAKARLDDAIDSLSSAIRELRAYILNIRPQLKSKGSLAEELETLVEQYRVQTQSDITLDINGVPELDSRTSWQIVQLAREALSNVARHAAANRVDVRLSTDGGHVCLEIADDGRGFDPANATSRTGGGQGLRNMADRAADLGGQLQIDSQPGTGTRLRLVVPKAQGGY